MESCLITSKENRIYKNIKKLKEKKYRDREGLFLAEGRKFIDFNQKPEFVIIDEGFDMELGDIKEYKIASKLFKKLSSQENSQGIIFVYKIKKMEILDLSGDLVILDKIQDPGNMGTIIRTCDAVGLNNILLIKGCVDIYSEKVVRSSMGSIFNCNFVSISEKDCIDYLKENSYEILTTGLSDNSVDYNEIELKEKNAYVFGNEGNGVSDNIFEVSNQIVKIPIYGIAESLNVGIALGIFLYKVREILNFKR